MYEPPVAIRLPRTFDVERLLSDLRAIEHTTWLRQPGGYHDGRWTGLSLFAAGGRSDSAMGVAPSMDAPAATELLAQAPYFREVMDSFECPKLVARLLALPPGARINEHCDDTTFQSGIVRLHVPVVTHPDVVFMIAGERCVWRAGELWYGDFSRVHSVENKSDVRRVHLVVDMLINDWLLGLFPAEFVQHQKDLGVSKYRAPVALDATSLDRFVCDFQLPPGMVPMAPSGGEGSVQRLGSRLVVLVNDDPAFGLEPVSDTTLGIVGTGGGVVIECEFDGGRVSRATLSVRINGSEDGLKVDLPIRRSS
jgi:hypothetical protein